jgi:hypothetical protein
MNINNLYIINPRRASLFSSIWTTLFVLKPTHLLAVLLASEGLDFLGKFLKTSEKIEEIARKL